MDGRGRLLRFIERQSLPCVKGRAAQWAARFYRQLPELCSGKWHPLSVGGTSAASDGGIVCSIGKQHSYVFSIPPLKGPGDFAAVAFAFGDSSLCTREPLLKKPFSCGCGAGGAYASLRRSPKSSRNRGY